MDRHDFLPPGITYTQPDDYIRQRQEQAADQARLCGADREDQDDLPVVHGPHDGLLTVAAWIAGAACIFFGLLMLLDTIGALISWVRT